MTTPKRTFVVRLVRLLLVAGMIGIGGTLAHAQTGNPVQAKNGKKYVATREIIFDRANGMLRRPTDAETQTLLDQIVDLTNRSTDGLTMRQGANGATIVDLQGRFGGVLLGRAAADGTTEVRCVMTLDEAVQFLGLEEVVPQQ